MTNYLLIANVGRTVKNKLCIFCSIFKVDNILKPFLKCCKKFIKLIKNGGKVEVLQLNYKVN